MTDARSVGLSGPAPQSSMDVTVSVGVIQDVLQDPLVALFAGALVGIALTTFISFAAREVSAKLEASRLVGRLERERVRAYRQAEVTETREWCLRYLSACLAWRMGDAESYLAWARAPTQQVRARIDVLGDKVLMERFSNLTTQLRRGKFGSWVSHEELVGFGILQVEVLNALSGQEVRAIRDQELREVIPGDAGSLRAQVAELAGLVPRKPPSELRRVGLLSAWLISLVFGVGFAGRALKRMWTN